MQQVQHISCTLLISPQAMLRQPVPAVTAPANGRRDDTTKEVQRQPQSHACYEFPLKTKCHDLVARAAHMPWQGCDCSVHDTGNARKLIVCSRSGRTWAAPTGRSSDIDRRQRRTSDYINNVLFYFSCKQARHSRQARC
jgi:hypothetical protein